MEAYISDVSLLRCGRLRDATSHSSMLVLDSFQFQARAWSSYENLAASLHLVFKVQRDESHRECDERTDRQTEINK